MTPELAYDWLAPKLDLSERKVLDVIYKAAMADYDPTPAQYVHLDAKGNVLAVQAEPIPGNRLAAGDRVETLHRKRVG